MMKKYIKKLFSWEPKGSIRIIFPDGSEHLLGSEETDLYMKFNNYKIVWNFFTSRANAFSDCYVNGDIECSDLTSFFIFYLRNKENFDNMAPFKILKLNLSYLSHVLRWNSISGARKNIRAHYDMGNDFFAEWLDDSMQYSSAHFNEDNKTLEEAQNNKLQKLNAYLDIKDDDTLLEIGCGWGTLAQYLFNKNNINIDAITISDEQLKFARTLNLKSSNKKCDFKLQDYRNTDTKYNKIVSIEMIEAVGKKYLPIYLDTIKKCLKNDGHAIIQGITIADDKFDEYSNQVDFIQKYIFPGGFLPSQKYLKDIAMSRGLEIETLDELNLSYAKTLRIWRERFNTKWSKIRTMGYDDKFRRIWNYYLSYCEAGFIEKSIFINVFKFKPKN